MSLSPSFVSSSIYQIHPSILSYVHHHNTLFIRPPSQYPLHPSTITTPSSYVHHHNTLFIRFSSYRDSRFAFVCVVCLVSCRIPLETLRYGNTLTRSLPYYYYSLIIIPLDTLRYGNTLTRSLPRPRKFTYSVYTFDPQPLTLRFITASLHPFTYQQ